MKVALVVILFSFHSSAEWFTDIEVAKATAKKENKLVLLNFSGSDWCAPCIKLKKEVFESDGFQALATQKLVLVNADFPRMKKNQLSKALTESNEVLAEKYNRSGKFPLTVLLTAGGEIIKEWDGYVFNSQGKFLLDLKNQIDKK